MGASDNIEYKEVNPEEIIRRLKRLLDYYERKESVKTNNEKELSNSSIS